MTEVLEVEVLPSTAEGFAGQIQVLQAKSVETLIEIGRVFLSAKATLPHGEFGKVAELCGVSADTVQRYMRVAKNEALSNAAHARLLPAAVTTLDALAAWPEDELRAALAEGVVRPEMTRDEVRELYNRRTRTDVETPLFLTKEAIVEARAAVDAGRVHANQLVREVAKRVRGMALSDEGLPDAAHAVRAAKWLCSQWTSESHPKPVQELARLQLVALAAGTVGPADATDVVRKEIAAHRPGTPEHRMRHQDQGPSAAPPAADVEAAPSAAAQGVDESATSPAPSSLEGADVEPAGDDTVPGAGEPSAKGSPAVICSRCGDEFRYLPSPDGLCLPCTDDKAWPALAADGHPAASSTRSDAYWPCPHCGGKNNGHNFAGRDTCEKNDGHPQDCRCDWCRAGVAWVTCPDRGCGRGCTTAGPMYPHLAQCRQHGAQELPRDADLNHRYPVDEAPSAETPTPEAFWSQLTEVQRDALELVVLENAENKTARYSNKTSVRDGDVPATVYHQTADVLLDFELLAFVADTMRTELEATERGIKLVLTFGKIAAGEAQDPAPGSSPVACTSCGGVYELEGGLCQGCAHEAIAEWAGEPWDELDDAGKWAQLKEPEQRMLIEAMWAADADEPPYGCDDGNLVQNELMALGLLEEVEFEDEWVGAVLTAEGMRLVRAFGTVEACPQCDALELRGNVCGACGWSAQAPRSEVTEVEEDPGGYPGASGWVETVHGKVGRGGSTSGERYREIELVAGEVFQSLALARESVPEGMTMERLLAEPVVRQRPEERAESREFMKWWRDQLNGALLLTEEVKAGGG